VAGTERRPGEGDKNLQGGFGNDTLNVDDGDINDLATGGADSNDVCEVDFGAEASHTCGSVSFD